MPHIEFAELCSVLRRDCQKNFFHSKCSRLNKLAGQVLRAPAKFRTISPALLVAIGFAILLNTGCQTGFHTAKPVRLKLMTYNIRIGKGGGPWNNDPTKVDLEPVARLIFVHSPDIIGLQEVDRFRKRTSLMDQPKVLGEKLKMNWAFQPAYTTSTGATQEEQYGIAAMSHFALGPSERFLFYKPDYSKTHPEYPDYYSEQRALLHTTISIDGRTVHVFVTHLGLTVDQREKQIAEIARVTARYDGPKIVMGDFNAKPEEPALKLLEKDFQDALTVVKATNEERKSFPAGLKPTEAIDYIFVSPEFRVLKAEVIRDETLVSDHNPVIAEVELLPTKR